MSAFTISELNGIKIYNLSAGKTTFEFLDDAKKKSYSLKYNKEFRARIEIIQDFNFTIASTQVNMTPDQKYIIATGIYAPQVKIYETSELSMKCLRGMDSECVKFCILTEDYSKLAFACMDRNIEIQAQYGKHDKIRVPKTPRDMVFNQFTCDLIVAANDNQIYRINLDQGKFLASFNTVSNTINTLHYDKHLNILLSGGENGILEMWDYRQREKICQLILNEGQELSKIASESQGMQFSIGSKEGLFRSFDYRSPQECILNKQFQYMLPINSIIYHAESKNIIASDSKIIKIFNKDTGRIFTNYEPQTKLNGIELVANSGLILAAVETSRIGAFFIPALAPAPKWCPFVENITEELEENLTDTIYDEFKFVNYEDLEKINATSLIGTKNVRQYMHGYLIHSKLYQKLKGIAKPFEYEEYRKEQIKKKLEIKRESRISFQKMKSRKVNQQLYDELEGNKNNAKSKGKKEQAERLLADNRFKDMFTKPEFQKLDKQDQMLSNRQNVIDGEFSNNNHDQAQMTKYSKKQMQLQSFDQKILNKNISKGHKKVQKFNKKKKPLIDNIKL